MGQLIEVGSSGRTVQLLPVGSLKCFGVNPYGEATFRVAWSESRYYLVGANHVIYHGNPSPDKTIKQRGKDPSVTKTVAEYRWLPLYPSTHCWVLELWKSPFGYTGCTPEQYKSRYLDKASGLLSLGPYPERGEYCECKRFPTGIVPGRSIVEQQIGLIKAGWNYTYKAHEAANRDALEKVEKDKMGVLEAIFHDSQQAFKNRASNVNPAKKKKEDVKMKYSAEDLKLNPRGFSTNARNS